VSPALGPVGSGRVRALLLGVFVPFAVWTVPPLLADVVRRPQANDFRLYYYAAKLGLTYGWSHLYDAGLQSRLLKDLFFQPYLNPPAMAWLVLPLSVLPFLAARVIWTVLLLVALVGAWWLLKPAGQRPQVFWLLGFLALFPAAFSIGIGQPHTLLLLALALAVRLRERGHDGWAGVVLSAFWLKPQIAFLLPVALIAARQWRMLLGLGVAGGLLGVAQVVALGPDGVRQYLAALQVASTWDLQRRFSLAGLVPSPLFLVLRVIVVGLLLAASAGGSRKAQSRPGGGAPGVPAGDALQRLPGPGRTVRGGVDLAPRVTLAVRAGLAPGGMGGGRVHPHLGSLADRRLPAGLDRPAGVAGRSALAAVCCSYS